MLGRVFPRSARAALAAAGLALARPAAAAPEPAAAGAALLAAPFQVAGDVAGGAGLIAAAGVALVGDSAALLDRESPAKVALRGVPSGALHGLAFGLSRASSGALELLRREDIERWPEPAAAYFTADPFVGRLDQLATGFGAVCLGVRDALGAPLLALLRAAGATQQAERFAERRREDRIVTLGPEPAPDVH